MVAHINTICFLGIEPQLVDVQLHIAPGLPCFNIVGLPDKAISESKERVRAAFSSISLGIPAKRITVNLAPAYLLKEGSHLDLAIATALMVAMSIIDQEEIMQYIVMGELSLDGKINGVNGTLPAAIYANSLNMGLVCPSDNGTEAALSGNNTIIPANSLLSLVNHFTGKQYISPPTISEINTQQSYLDFKDVKGQKIAKRAMEIAAAGCHNVIMIGPPGSGKSMLAKRLPSILPKLTQKERLNISVIQSIAGEFKDNTLSNARTFRAPHNSCSVAAMVGGGKNVKPGEITLAHLGVLFLDELPEFSRNVLESLRQPIESGDITIARANHHVTYPAKFQLIAAMNPCKCGYFRTKLACSKTPKCAEDYQSKISGPLFDRFDIQVEVGEINILEEEKDQETERSEAIAKRVAVARTIQKERYASHGIKTNSELDGELLQNIIALCDDSKKLLNKSINQLSLSMRAFNKVLRLARTIADLEEQQAINQLHLAEALTYRIKR